MDHPLLAHACSLDHLNVAPRRPEETIQDTRRLARVVVSTEAGLHGAHSNWPASHGRRACIAQHVRRLREMDREFLLLLGATCAHSSQRELVFYKRAEA